MERPLVVLADGPQTPVAGPAAALEFLGTDDVDLLLGWTVAPAGWLDALKQGAARTVMGGYALAPHIARGAVGYLPVRLAAMPRLVAGPLRPSVLVVRGCPRGAGFAFADSIGWSRAAALTADSVVVLVDEQAPDLGSPIIPGRVERAVAAEFVHQGPVEGKLDAVDRRVGETVAAMIPEGATIQFGPGAMSAAIVASIDRPVGVWSGLTTSSLVNLAERSMLKGTAVSTYVWGDDRLTAFALN